jgi:hypothetical protein
VGLSQCSPSPCPWPWCQHWCWCWAWCGMPCCCCPCAHPHPQWWWQQLEADPYGLGCWLVVYMPNKPSSHSYWQAHICNQQWVRHTLPGTAPLTWCSRFHTSATRACASTQSTWYRCNLPLSLFFCLFVFCVFLLSLLVSFAHSPHLPFVFSHSHMCAMLCCNQEDHATNQDQHSCHTLLAFGH